MICAFCEENETIEKTYSYDILLVPRDWEGESITIEGLLGWYCKTCDEWTIDPRQIRHNEKLIATKRKERNDEIASMAQKRSHNHPK